MKLMVISMLSVVYSTIGMVNVIDNNFFCALEQKKLAVAERYLRYGANINAKKQDMHDRVQNYLTYFISDFDIVRFLINNKVNIHSKNSDGRTALHVICDFSVPIEVEFKDELFFDQRFEVAKLLLAAGANSNAQDNGGNTPLILLLYHQAQSAFELYSQLRITKLILGKMNLDVSLRLVDRLYIPQTKRMSYGAKDLLQHNYGYFKLLPPELRYYFKTKICTPHLFVRNNAGYFAYRIAQIILDYVNAHQGDSNQFFVAPFYTAIANLIDQEQIRIINLKYA